MHGSKRFYEGEVADDFINSLSKLGGDHSYDDLQAVSVEYVKPLSLILITTNYLKCRLMGKVLQLF